MSSLELDYQYKILILGDATVGKTSLLTRFIDNKYDPESLSTLGVDVGYKYILFNNKKIRIDIWDTAGQERFKNIAKNYFRGAHALIFVFNVNKKKTIQKLRFWLDNANENTSKETVKVLVGHKIDTEGEREVNFQQMKELGEKFKIDVFEASSKTGKGVNEIFIYLLKNLMKNPEIGVVREDFYVLDRNTVRRRNKLIEGCNC